MLRSHQEEAVPMLRRVICLLLLCALSSLAQGVSLPDRLPPDTSFYLAWHGSAQLDKARATNSLLRLWADPEFFPVRQAVTERFFAGAVKSTEKQSLSRAEVEELLTLVENPFVLGFSGSADWNTMLADKKPEGTAPTTGFFMIYDLTGKAELHRKFLERARANEKEKPTITNYEFSGVKVEQSTKAKSTDYETYVANYYIVSDKKEVIENLITRLQAATAPATSLSHNADFESAQHWKADGAFLEFFLRMPDFGKINFPSQQAVDVPAMFRAMHMERLRAFAGSVSLAGEGSRLRFAILGDTSPGSLFDIFGAPSPTFPTLAAAPPGASYSATRLDLPALYATLRNAIKAGLPPEQSANVEMMEGMAGTQFGMGIPEMLGVLAGEVATISVGPEGDPTALADMYAVAIRRPEDVVRVLHVFLGQRITSEEQEGDVTYLAVSTPYTDEKTGAQRSRFNHVAVTPQMVLTGPRKTLVREAVARVAAAKDAAATGSLSSDPQFLLARQRLPQSLTAVSYSDLARVPWEKMAQEMVKQFDKDAKDAPTVSPAAVKALPAVVARYLHTVFGGWWKERGGVFAEMYLD